MTILTYDPKDFGMRPKDQRLEFILKEDDYTLKFDSNAVTADEVLEHFIQFMRGCGYRGSSIHEAMEALVDERNRELQEDKAAGLIPTQGVD
jgi:hypothetical protein